VECESVPLLESWKGDAVSLLLDAWGKFIESPLLLIADAGNNGALHAQEHVQHINLPSELKLLVRKVAIDVFQKIFDSVLYVTIADSLKNMVHI
jgi:hypothetical protein